MRIGVYTNRVSMGHEKPTFIHQSLSLFLKYGDVPRLGRDVQPLQAGIKGENVGGFPDRMCRQYLHGGQINDGELVVFLSRHEGQSLGYVKGNTVRALYSG